MIPSDIRLYTWVDVEEVLLRLQGNWPEWLVWATGYWDSLTLGIRAGTQEEAKNWLEDVYNPRWRNDSEEEMVGGVIILESIKPENPRTLPVLFEETEEEPPKARLIPSLSRPSVLWQQGENQELPPILPSNLPPIVAFHSFKGGVGRTTHALALAQAIIGEKQKVQEVRQKTAAALGFGQIQDSSSIRDYIRESCRENLHVGEWRDRWLYIMAWGAGFPVTEPQLTGNRDRHIGRALIQHLLDQKKQLIFAIDGLEDLFQNFATNENEQIALRALLQEVPEWLGQQPGIPLGILIFVRRDIVLAAVRQNAAQMMALYDNYALKWNREETLRLVAWITNLAGITPAKIQVEYLAGMGETELTEALIPLWGKRLGSERSKEAGSARYVLAVLSDYKGQIQARDLVRLLYIAAQNSVTDNRWHERILIPTAIRDALPECSQEKIQEIEQENISLKTIFTKLRSLPEENRKIPFTPETINLSLEEIKTLEDNGVVIREKDEYYITEIFRLGLGFFLTTAGRLKVLTLAGRAGQKS